MKELGQFGAPTPELERTLVAFQDNVSDAVDKLESSAEKAFKLVPAQQPGKAIVPLRAGEMVLVDGNCEVVLASPQPSDEGRKLLVIQRGAGTVVMRPVSGLINGVSSTTLFFSGRYEIVVADGAYWGPA